MSPLPFGARWFPKLVLGAVSLGLALLVLEVGARLIEAPARPSADVRDLPILDPGPGIRAPRVHGQLVGRAFRTNSHGFRGPEYAATPPAGTLRVAVTGDSVTMGWGVDEDEAYPALLASRLAEMRPETGFEVINLGIAGANLEEAMDRLETAIDAYDPHLFVYGVTVNDIEGEGYRLFGHPLAHVALMVERRRFEDSPLALLRLLWPRWIVLRERLSPSVRDYGEEVRWNYFENEATRDRLGAGLDRLRRLAEGSGACGHVLIHTELADLSEDHAFTGVYQTIATEARARGLTVTESLEAHLDDSTTGLRISQTDGHPNAAGHRLLADLLAASLAALPDACLRP